MIGCKAPLLRPRTQAARAYSWRLAAQGLSVASLVDEPLSSSDGVINRSTLASLEAASADRELAVTTAALAALGKRIPRGESPGSVARGETRKAGLTVVRSQAVVDSALILVVVLHAGSVGDTVGVVSPADDLVPAEAAKRRVLLLVRVGAKLAEGAGDLDEVAHRRDLVDIAVAVEHLREESDSGIFASGGGNIAVVIPAGSIIGPDSMVVHTDIRSDFKEPAGSSGSKIASGTHLSRGPGISAPHSELSIAQSSP